MKRRSFVAGAAALAALPFIKPKQTQAQFFTGRTGGVTPIPPSPQYVTVTQGASQAVIQVLKPADETTFTLTVSGGGPPYPLDGSGFDYWINGVQVPWNGGMNSGQYNDVIARTTINVTNQQWHVVFAATPTVAANEIVTVITVDAIGASYTPMTLAQAHALAPQLFT